MMDLNKIVENLNLPKQILDKTEALAKTLFGPSFSEFADTIADEVRARRWRNQLKIFENAQKLLVERGISPQNVSLKVLAPLIEFSSYEEEKSLQDKWSNLIADVVSNTGDVLFHQNCISVLNKISCAEANLLDELDTAVKRMRKSKYKEGIERYQRQKEIFTSLPLPKEEASYPLKVFPFHKKWVAEKQNISIELAEYMISNLVTLGVLNWDISVEVEAEKSNEDPEDKEIDVNVDVNSTNYFIFTLFGSRFVHACKNN